MSVVTFLIVEGVGEIDVKKTWKLVHQIDLIVLVVVMTSSVRA